MFYILGSWILILCDFNGFINGDIYDDGCQL